ncbi:uncharacterized protein RHOBADRAFT_53730, partial [Rhodotorula graminis WP1]
APYTRTHGHYTYKRRASAHPGCRPLRTFLHPRPPQPRSPTAQLATRSERGHGLLRLPKLRPPERRVQAEHGPLQLVRHDPRPAVQLAAEQLVRPGLRARHLPPGRRRRHVDQRRLERRRRARPGAAAPATAAGDVEPGAAAERAGAQRRAAGRATRVGV